MQESTYDFLTYNQTYNLALRYFQSVLTLLDVIYLLALVHLGSNFNKINYSPLLFYRHTQKMPLGKYDPQSGFN